MTIVATGLSMGACATNDRYGYDRYGDRNNGQLERAATGAAVGAAAGAALGAVVGGVSTVEGAAAGAVAGGVIGAVTNNDRRYYRDDRGYCYYVDRSGRRVYDDRGCGYVTERR
jgi:uncharacterized protein YcfJ